MKSKTPEAIQLISPEMVCNEKQNAGSYTVDFNGDGLPSGVYFYKLEAGEFTETKRMILLK